ncbi:RICIN domain-containing protein [Actinokineospora terrae]|uniref:Ricin-type beta-trefoil lectin domain-containing protein n=1 Tax=Actinokineospora terrae TaxID=155974 RepID=A0A1H9X3I8_9PSEU|nr:RICIN domain-containing protein [Actinokineospora terrae]SES40752.1 Ricin-type beta-trefoil lectin domain-containing protein [Actinokineospora terrae]
MRTIVRKLSTALAALTLIPALLIAAAAPASAGGFGAIRARSNLAMCLDISRGSTKNHEPIQIYYCNGGQNQAWEFTPDTIGPDHASYGLLINRASGKCVDVESASLAPGAHIEQYTCFPGTRNQLWSYDFASGRFRALHSGLCISAVGPGNKVRTVQWHCADSTRATDWEAF